MPQSAAEFFVRDDGSGDDLHDSAFFRRGCCCFFNFPCSKSRKSDNWERISSLSGEQESSCKRNWWDKGIDALKNVRKLSELVAGPKWKTFIRRFNKIGGRARSGKFHYDPSNYSLNFDEGRGQNRDFVSDLNFRDISSRYSAIPVQNVQTKNTMSSTWQSRWENEY